MNVNDYSRSRQARFLSLREDDEASDLSGKEAPFSPVLCFHLARASRRRRSDLCDDVSLGSRGQQYDQ